jgi:hypothetical protein
MHGTYSQSFLIKEAGREDERYSASTKHAHFLYKAPGPG